MKKALGAFFYAFDYQKKYLNVKIIYIHTNINWSAYEKRKINDSN